MEIRVVYENFPTLTAPGDLINFLVRLVSAGIVSSRE
jgi:hypothetical protein